MSASFYDLMKYARTGIASPSMTYYDKQKALAMCKSGFPISTITGVTPLSFKANGKPLISWSMLGNGSQSGTPSPQSIIMPTFCGVRTEQLINPEMIFNKSASTIGGAFPAGEGGNRRAAFVYVAPNTSYTFSIGSQTTDRLVIAEFNSIVDPTTATSYVPITPDNVIYTVNTYSGSKTFTTGSSAKMVMVYYALNAAITNPMLNAGTKPLPYEPYGWAEKITCAGQTVPVYLGQTQTVRRVRKLVLTSTTADWTYDSAYNRYAFRIADSLIVGVCLTPVACSHFVSISDGRSIGDVPNNAIYSNSQQTTNNWFIKTTDYTTASSFKQFLDDELAAGTPVCVWYVLAEPTTGIVNEPLAKIGDYADELHSTDAGVTIPTAKGQNTLTVDTELQPSSMTITYKK